MPVASPVLFCGLSAELARVLVMGDKKRWRQSIWWKITSLVFLKLVLFPGRGALRQNPKP
jgi:hypothetical protein